MNHKKFTLTALMSIGLLLSVCQSTYADENETDLLEKSNPWKPAASMNHVPTRKFGRGVVNIVFGWIEVPKTMIEINKGYGGFAGISWGTLLGVKRTAVRMVVGCFEVTTFWFRQGVIVEPEFPFMPEEVVNWRVKHPAKKTVVPKNIAPKPGRDMIKVSE